MRIMPGGALETEQSLSGPSSIFVGKKLDEHRGSFILEYPMDKGHVVDGGWDAMESLWEVRKKSIYKSNLSAFLYVAVIEKTQKTLTFCLFLIYSIASLFETKY